MSESDNVQRARSEMHRCTTHALYRSKLWQQDHCQHPQNANLNCHELQGRSQGDENKVSGYGYGLRCGFKWGPHHTTSHLRSRLQSQHYSEPGLPCQIRVSICRMSHQHDEYDTRPFLGGSGCSAVAQTRPVAPKKHSPKKSASGARR